MTITDDIKSYFKQLNAYKWGLLLAAILGFGVLLPLFVLYFLHTGSLPPVQYFWMPFAGISLLFSGLGYVGKALGFIKNTLYYSLTDNSSARQKFLTFENIGVTVGVILGGIFAGLALGVFGDHSLFPVIFQDHSLAANIGGCVFSSISFFSVYGGVNNRIGRGVIDRSLNAKKVDANYSYGIRGGLAIGIGITLGVLIFCHLATPVFPLLLVSFAVIGMCASVSGYVGRVFDHLLGQDTHLIDLLTDKEKRDKVFSLSHFKERTNGERIGTAVGITIGIVCGAFLVAHGLLMMPFFGAGTPAVVAGILMIAACANIGAGLGNRLGCLFDKEKTPEEMELMTNSDAENSEIEQKKEEIDKQPAAVTNLKISQALTQKPGIAQITQEDAAPTSSAPKKERQRSSSFSFRHSKVSTYLPDAETAIHSRHLSLKGFGGLIPDGKNPTAEKLGFNC